MLVATQIRFPDGWTERALVSVPEGTEPAPEMVARKVTILLYNPTRASRKVCEKDYLTP